MPKRPTAHVAQICHEANRAFCLTFGDASQLPWDEAPEWQRQSAINGVEFARSNPSSSPAASHENWMKEKLADGWKRGPVKDPIRKEHPCLVPYAELPVEQQAKDHLFQAIVRAIDGAFS